MSKQHHNDWVTMCDLHISDHCENRLFNTYEWYSIQFKSRTKRNTIEEMVLFRINNHLRGIKVLKYLYITRMKTLFIQKTNSTLPRKRDMLTNNHVRVTACFQKGLQTGAMKVFSDIILIKDLKLFITSYAPIYH